MTAEYALRRRRLRVRWVEVRQLVLVLLLVVRAAIAEELDGRCDDIGGITFLTVFIIPAAGLETAFDIDRTAFRQILCAVFALLTPNCDSVPFGALLAVTVVIPGLSGSHIECANARAAWSMTHLRVAT